jgi:hypothetical protein
MECGLLYSAQETRRTTAWSTFNTDHNSQQKRGVTRGTEDARTQITCPEVWSPGAKHYPNCGNPSGPHITHITVAHQVQQNFNPEIHSMVTPVMHTYSGIIKSALIGWHFIQPNKSTTAIVWSTMRSLLRRKVSFPLYFSNNAVRKKNRFWL